MVPNTSKTLLDAPSRFLAVGARAGRGVVARRDSLATAKFCEIARARAARVSAYHKASLTHLFYVSERRRPITEAHVRIWMDLVEMAPSYDTLLQGGTPPEWASRVEVGAGEPLLRYSAASPPPGLDGSESYGS